MFGFRSSGYVISEHNVVSPEVCHGLVKDLQSPVGKGNPSILQNLKKDNGKLGERGIANSFSYMFVATEKRKNALGTKIFVERNETSLSTQSALKKHRADCIRSTLQAAFLVY